LDVSGVTDEKNSQACPGSPVMGAMTN